MAILDYKKILRGFEAKWDTGFCILDVGAE